MPKSSKSSSESPYREIRAVSRALDLLEAVSELGWANVGQLANYTGIDRGTTYRLIHTLELKGYLERRAEDGTMSLANRILELGDGVRHEDIAVQVMSQTLRELTEQIMWPSDFASFNAGHMVIQASSHKYSPVSVHRRLIGKTRSLFRSALGMAYLSSLNIENLNNTIEIAQRIGNLDAADRARSVRINQELEKVHLRGYAASEGLVEAKFSAIALPVRIGRKPIGAVNIVFFRNAMAPDEAGMTLLRPLRDMIARAEQLMGVAMSSTGLRVGLEKLSIGPVGSKL